MKKKILYPIGITMWLLICILAYFKPLSLADTAKENKRIDIILNEFEIEDDEPNIESVVYNDLTAEQNSAIVMTSSGKIAVNDKSYGMEDAAQLIKQIIDMVE